MSRRRDIGTGSLFRHSGCKRWVIQFYRDGRRIREATGLTSKRKAQDLLTERLGQVRRGDLFARERKPARVEELFEDLKRYCQIHGLRSFESLGRRWKHLSPVFGNLFAANLTTDSITRYTLFRQKEGAASATINRELAMLRRALNLGRQCTPPKIRVVPYIPLLKEDNVRRGFVEDADFSKLSAHASELWMRTFLELAFTYGWRKSELLGLRVRQVNLEQRTIRLDPGTTKNREGREVAMTTKVAELLRSAVAEKRPDDFVFTRAGKPVRNLRQAWYNLCVQSGYGSFVCSDCERHWTAKECQCGSKKRQYRGLIIHDLRRSAAKALRAAGVPESVIMAAGG
jgi:integrase